MSKKWRLLLLSPFLLLPFAQSISSALQPKVDFFAPPANLGEVLENSKKATFEVFCGGWVGSGWGINLEGDDYIVTAFHVIEECLDGQPIMAKNGWHGAFDLELLSYDGSYWSDDSGGLVDLALLKSSREIDTFEVQTEQVELGQWVIGLGYPSSPSDDGFLSPVEGRITGKVGYDVLVTDAAINHGHSGGPLINSAGQVLGTIFAGEDIAEYENMSYAESMSLHCNVVFFCLSDTPQAKRPTIFIQKK